MKHELFPWLILFLPLLSAAVITLFTLRCKTTSSLISIGAVVAGFVMTVIFVNANGIHFSGETAANWLSIGNLNVEFGLKLDGQVLVFFIITVAAAEVSVGLALIVALYRKRQSAHVEDLTSMKL